MGGKMKQPVRLTRLLRVRAARRSIQAPASELPAVLIMEFGHADGPAAVSDGRELRAVLSPAELADVLGSVPASCLTSDSMFALMRVTDLLSGEHSRYAGIRLDDLRAVLRIAGSTARYTASDQEHAALKRLREIAQDSTT